LTPADEEMLDRELKPFNIYAKYDGTYDTDVEDDDDEDDEEEEQSNTRERRDLTYENFTCPWTQLGKNCTPGLKAWTKERCGVLIDTSSTGIFSKCLKAIPDKTVGPKLHKSCLILTCRCQKTHSVRGLCYMLSYMEQSCNIFNASSPRWWIKPGCNKAAGTPRPPIQPQNATTVRPTTTAPIKPLPKGKDACILSYYIANATYAVPGVVDPQSNDVLKNLVAK
ncbi:unnamed protein product, partial [Didymodactylos carnosus]